MAGEKKAVVRDGYVALVPFNAASNPLDDNRIRFTALAANVENISNMIRRTELTVSFGSEDASVFGDGGWETQLGTSKSWSCRFSGFASRKEAARLYDLLTPLVLAGTAETTNTVGILISDVPSEDTYKSTAQGNAVIQIPKVRTLSGTSPFPTLTATDDRRTFAGIGSVQGDLNLLNREFGQVEPIEFGLSGVGPIVYVRFKGASSLTESSDDPGIGMDDNDTALIDLRDQELKVTTVA